MQSNTANNTCIIKLCQTKDVILHFQINSTDGIKACKITFAAIECAHR